MEKEATEITKKLVTDFITAMNNWEKQCRIIEKENINFEEQHHKQKQLVTEIFAQFVTPKERKQSRPNTISYGDEGSYEYDPEEEIILSAKEEKANKIIVATYREDPLDEQFEYSVVQKGGKWLIDTKKCYDDLKEKWVNQSL